MKKPDIATDLKMDQGTPEAHLEAVVGQVLSRAFVGIDRQRVRHQTRFTVRIGHTTREYDGADGWVSTGRADIILFYDDRALAIIELKRGELTLSQDDIEQAKSYAKQFDRRPPLVVLTNGDDVRTIDGNTGEDWIAEDGAENAVAKLLKNAAAIAKADMRWAMEVLMGPGSEIWPSVARERTVYLLEQLTAPVGSGGKPFAAGLHYSRAATLEVMAKLASGASFVFVLGPPLAGKSNVLRELAYKTKASSEFAVLMLRGGSSGLFQSIANILSAALEWNVNPNDIRQWLRRLAKYGYGPALILAVDGLQPGGAMAADLEEIADTPYGEKLRIVATVDNPDKFMTAHDGRTRTAIADRSLTVKVAGLSKREFNAAAATLAGHGIHFARGAGHEQDLRAPWVLRTLYDQCAGALAGSADALHFRLPPSLGLNLVEIARSTFAHQLDMLHGYHLMAADMLGDATRSPGLSLAQSYAFTVRRDGTRPVEAAESTVELAAWMWAVA